MTTSSRRIVLAYSGSPETAGAMPWLAERYQAEVVTLTLDLGQGDELTDARERALAAGAVRAHVIDAREELVRDYIVPSLHAGALYHGRYPLPAALARAAIAKRLVDVARMESAFGVAFGSGLETSVRTLNPSLTVIALKEGATNGLSGNVNLWGRSLAADGHFKLTRAAIDSPDEPAYLEIEFDTGIPVRANGIEMSMLELIESLEIIAGAHGVGRLHQAEQAGASNGGIAHEAPASVLLHAAHQDLEAFVTPPDLARVKQDLARVYANLVHEGRWFSPTRDAIDAFVRTIQPRVTGSVRLKLYKGDCQVAGRSSPFASEGIVPSHVGEQFDSAAAEGVVS